MSYSTLAQVTQAFDPTQWDPTRHTPDTTTVEGWLDDWSAVLDGEIANLVAAPVDADASPHLHALCAQITALRVRADVYDAKYPPKSGEQVASRQSAVWREQAERLVKRILAGGTADGLPASGTADIGVTPTGAFGADAKRDHRSRPW